jgi:hypothetical protein
MFSDNVQFIFESNRAWDYTNYSLIAPLIWSLTYDCGLEQKHITNLLISDFNQNEIKRSTLTGAFFMAIKAKNDSSF